MALPLKSSVYKHAELPVSLCLIVMCAMTVPWEEHGGRFRGACEHLTNQGPGEPLVPHQEHGSLRVKHEWIKESSLGITGPESLLRRSAALSAKLAEAAGFLSQVLCRRGAGEGAVR